MEWSSVCADNCAGQEIARHGVSEPNGLPPFPILFPRQSLDRLIRHVPSQFTC